MATTYIYGHTQPHRLEKWHAFSLYVASKPMPIAPTCRHPQELPAVSILASHRPNRHPCSRVPLSSQGISPYNVGACVFVSPPKGANDNERLRETGLVGPDCTEKERPPVVHTAPSWPTRPSLGPAPTTRQQKGAAGPHALHIRAAGPSATQSKPRCRVAPQRKRTAPTHVQDSHLNRR